MKGVYKNIAHAHYLFGYYKCVVNPRFSGHFLLSELWLWRYEAFNGAVHIFSAISATIVHAVPLVLRSCAQEPRFLLLLVFLFVQRRTFSWKKAATEKIKNYKFKS